MTVVRTMEQFDALPVGQAIWTDDEREFRRTERGWETADGVPLDRDLFTGMVRARKVSTQRTEPVTVGDVIADTGAVRPHTHYVVTGVDENTDRADVLVFVGNDYNGTTRLRLSTLRRAPYEPVEDQSAWAQRAVGMSTVLASQRVEVEELRRQIAASATHTSIVTITGTVRAEVTLDDVRDYLGPKFTETRVTSGAYNIHWSREVEVVKGGASGCLCHQITNDDLTEFLPANVTAWTFEARCA